MNIDKLLTNKKFLIAIGAIVLIAIIVILLLNGKQKPTPPTNKNDNIYVDDSEYIEATSKISDYLSANHPIEQLLPLRNQSPFYYITILVDHDESSNYFATLQISYYTEEGKSAAIARLKSAEFAEYHPENYPITYLDLNNY